MSDDTATVLVDRATNVVLNVVVGAFASSETIDAVRREGKAAGAQIGWVRAADGTFAPQAVPSVPPIAAQLVAYAEASRFAIETGGITVGGSRIRTDRASQGMIGRAVELAKEFPDEPIDFKGPEGWVTVDSVTMLDIGRAVGLHVRRLFTLERRADEAINAGTATTFADVDRILAGGVSS